MIVVEFRGGNYCCLWSGIIKANIPQDNEDVVASGPVRRILSNKKIIVNS